MPDSVGSGQIEWRGQNGRNPRSFLPSLHSAGKGSASAIHGLAVLEISRCGHGLWVSRMSGNWTVPHAAILKAACARPDKHLDKCLTWTNARHDKRQTPWLDFNWLFVIYSHHYQSEK
jgi:hypothetical protein